MSITSNPSSPLTSSRSGKPVMLDALGEIRLTHEMELIDEILDSGTNSVAVTLTDPKTYGEHAFQAALDDLLAFDQHIANHTDRLFKATGVADITRAVESRRLAIIYQLQNSTPIQKDVERVNRFHTLGLRSLQLTYNYQNYVGAGCRERCDGGLTVFGIELIERMNAIGMLVDTSHAGMRTMADAIAASTAPITVSHTCCESVHSHVRNTTDENLRALAEKGGVVGICQIRTFVTNERGDNLHRYFDHIDHAVRVAGIDHVCIGSDRDHRVIPDSQREIDILIAEEGAQFNPDEWPLYLTGMNGPRRMEVVWDGLVKRGYSADDVEKILSRNLHRLYTDVIG
jgi:membrane dipeptidase